MDILNTMKIVGDFWVAEYSATQKAFNIDTFANILETNCRMVAEKENNNNDYLIFGIFKTAQEANIACDVMKQKQQERAGVLL